MFFKQLKQSELCAVNQLMFFLFCDLSQFFISLKVGNSPVKLFNAMAIQNNSCISKLSQDHFLEVLFCERIDAGIRLNITIERLKEYVAYFWHQHLVKHFFEEEELLFKNVDDVFCTKGKQDHISIIAEIEHIITDTGVGKHHFSQLTSSIHHHISFEERVLFPHLELLLSPQALENIQKQLAKSHIDSFKDSFPDEFWLTN